MSDLKENNLKRKTITEKPKTENFRTFKGKCYHWFGKLLCNISFIILIGQVFLLYCLDMFSAFIDSGKFCVFCKKFFLVVLVIAKTFENKTFQHKKSQFLLTNSRCSL